MALRLYDFDAGKFITRAIGRGGPKKVSIFRAHPFQWPLKWDVARFNIITSRAIQITGSIIVTILLLSVAVDHKMSTCTFYSLEILTARRDSF